MITRTINTNGAPLINVLGNPLKNVDVMFTLVDFKGKPTDAYDFATHERISGTVRVQTDDTGNFSVSLWPTSRANKPVYYLVHINFTGFLDFTSALEEGATELDFAEMREYGRSAKPVEAQMLQKTLDDLMSLFGVSMPPFKVGFGGVAAYQFVVLNAAGEVITADPANADHLGKVFGMSLGTGNMGDTVIVCRRGTIVSTSWNLNPSLTYYLAPGGGLTDIAPSSGIMQTIGIAQTPQTLYVELGEPTLIL